MKEEVKQRMMQQIEGALIKLNHVPYIVSKRRKMVVWSDIRETLFLRCKHPLCSVVLSVLKSFLQYPASEKFMHPCTPSEQLQFMKQYIIVAPGTLLVDLCAFENRFELMTLYDMIKIKHDLSEDQVIKTCCCLSDIRTKEKHFQHCFENPLKNFTKKIFLPSIQRTSSKGDKTIGKDERSGRLIKSVLCNSYGEEAATALVPMYLLRETYPACVGLLEEAVRLYIIGRSEQANLKSVCPCSMEEGYLFSRFMAVQYGFDKQWTCITSNSLMISWEEFWQNSANNSDIRVVPNIHVSVVVLNNQNAQRLEEVLGTGITGKCSKSKDNAENENSRVFVNDITEKSDKVEEVLEFFEKKTDIDEQVFQEKIKTNENFLYRHVHNLKKSKSCTGPALSLQKMVTLDGEMNCTHDKLPDIYMKKKKAAKSSTEMPLTGPMKNAWQLEKRITRSRSQNTLKTDNNKGKYLLRSLEDKSGTYNGIRNTVYNPCNPDANNSAVLSDKQKSNNKIDKQNEMETKTDDDQSIEPFLEMESKENDLANEFEIGNIEISITPKKKVLDVKNDTTSKVAELNQESVPKNSNQTRKQNERKNMKVSSARFSDKIPDLLRIGKDSLRNDTSSLKYSKQLPTECSKSPAYKQENKQTITNICKHKEGTIVTKSLELSVLDDSPKPELKDNESFPYRAKRIKHVQKKEKGVNDDVFPVVNGIKLQSSPKKTQNRSLCKSAGLLPGPVNNLPIKPQSANGNKTGKLPDEIVSSLKQQASNSICSVLGNSDTHTLRGIVATGKEISSPRNKEAKPDVNSSDFQAERITMWKDRLGYANDKTGRICKSANSFHKKERMCTYRPTSSKYTPSCSDQKYGNGPSIKTGICALLSRERHTQVNPTKQEMKRQSVSPKKSHESKTAAQDEVDIQNYGSSSSNTPDIYDEFARKRKPRAVRPDLQIIKGKQISCERKYLQNSQIPTKDGEATCAKTKSPFYPSNPEMKVFSMDAKDTDGIDSAYKKNNERNEQLSNSGHQSYQHNKQYEIKNLPLTSNLYKILDANLSEARNSHQGRKQGIKYESKQSHMGNKQVGNESNSNQYTACSMCRHESNTHFNPESEILMEENNENTGLSLSSSIIQTDSPNDSVVSNDQYDLCDSLADIDSNSNITTDSFDMTKESDACTKDLHKVPEQWTSHHRLNPSVGTESFPRITLLDKMNLFVDGICLPKQSDSLEDLENIKNIIKINPIVSSQFQVSYEKSDSESINKSVSEQTKRVWTTPKHFIKPIYDTTEKLDTHFENVTFNMLIAKEQTPERYLGKSFKNWRDGSNESFNDETDSKPKLPLTKSLTVFDRGHNNAYLSKLTKLRKEIEDQNTENTVNTIQNVQMLENELNASSVNTPPIIARKEIKCDGCKNMGIIDTYSSFSDHYSYMTENEAVRSEDQAMIGMNLRPENKFNPPYEDVSVNRSTTKQNKFKSFKEVVEEKRAAKRRNDMEQAKKKYWKSAGKKSNDEEENTLNSFKHKPSSRKEKKILIKTLSEYDTAYESRNEITKRKKRPKTSPLKLNDKKQSSSEKNQSNHPKKITEYDCLRKSTYSSEEIDKNDTPESSFNQKRQKQGGQKKTRNAPKQKICENKTINDRILRPRKVKSSKTSRRQRKKLCPENEQVDDNKDFNCIQSSPIVQRKNTNISAQKSPGSPKFKARQRKLRSKLRDNVLSKQKEVCESTSKRKSPSDIERNVANALTSKQEEVIDESKIVCQTIPYENILETNLDIDNHDDMDQLTKAFITEYSTADLQHSGHDHFETVCNLIPNHIKALDNHVENRNSTPTQGQINSSYNAVVEMLKNNIESKEQIEENEQGSQRKVEDITQSWLYHSEDGEMRQVDLSELPQSVLEVVLSDNFMEMPISSPLKYEYRPDDFSLMTSNNPHYGNSYEQRPGENKCLENGDFQKESQDYIACVVPKRMPKIGEDCYCEIDDQSEQIETECHLENETPVLSNFKNTVLPDNVITVLHPSGTKVVLTENHPAFPIFSEIFLQQECDMEYSDRNDANEKEMELAMPLEPVKTDQFWNASSDNEDNKSLEDTCEESTHEKECKVYKKETVTSNNQFAIDSNHHVKIDNQQALFDSNDKICHVKPNVADTKSNNNTMCETEAVSKEQVSQCFYSNTEGKSTQFFPTSKDSNSFSHGENIFEVLSAELNVLSVERINNAQLELFPETVISDQNTVENQLNHVDFEDEFIKLISEDVDSNTQCSENGDFLKCYERKNEQFDCNALNENHLSYVKQSDLVNSNRPKRKSDKAMDNQQCYSKEPNILKISTFGSDITMTNPDEIPMVMPLDEQMQVFRSAAFGLRVSKTAAIQGNRNKHQDVSESESSRTYEYGAMSSTDLAGSDFNLSDFDSGDEDYYPEGEESECNMTERNRERVNAIFRKLKNFDEPCMTENSNEGSCQISCKKSENTFIRQEGSKCKNGKTDVQVIISSDNSAFQTNAKLFPEHVSVNPKLSPLRETQKEGNKSRYHNVCKLNEEEEEKMSPVKHKKRKRKTNRYTKMTRKDVAPEEEDENIEDTVSANNLVTMQTLYFNILKNSPGTMMKAHPKRSIDIETLLNEGFPLKRDRDMSRAESEAEKLKEGTGSLEDLERAESNDNIIEDGGSNCRYQIVEDEDGITLGGVVYYNEYVLPFVYINGYKYTPLKDAATLFQPDCCVWKCRIPKNIMAKNKKLIKTYSTWEQVYKLELIKMKKGPPVKTGDVLVKLDSFVSLLPSLLLDIIADHKDSKLKYSQDCDMKSYLTLQNKLK